MPAGTTLLVTAVIAIFVVFALAMTYAQFATRGIVAPGGRKPD